MMKKLLCLLLAAVLLTGCAPAEPGATTQPAQTQPTETRPTGPVDTDTLIAQISQLGQSPDDNYRVWYEIFVHSFCDSDGNGYGDLNGVRMKLPYLQELGITGIWLMPIHKSISYHKYNVTDYYSIDPDYGTMEDFDALIAACNELGIKVILDLVVNHTGSAHQWFKDACQYLKDLPEDQEPDSTVCPYVDYYHFGTRSKSGWNKVPGSDRFYYECQFASDMPDLNWECQAMRDDMRDVMEFWLNKGVAGFRLDAAKEFYSGNTDKNVEVLSWLQETAVSIKEDAYLVAEVWSDAYTISKYYESGITSIFSYAYGDGTGRIVSALRAAGNPEKITLYAQRMAEQDAANYAANPNYIDAPFLSNHDVGRIYGFVARDEAKTKLAGAMNLFMSGSAFIYYGEEIGMLGSGNDPSKRAPMYWSAEDDSLTPNPPPECVVPAEYPLGSLAQQQESESSVYNYYRQAIAIRKAIPAISHGVVTVEEALNLGCVSAQRKTWGQEACIILYNIDTAAATVDLSAYADWTLAASLSADGSPISMDGTALTLPPFGTAILIPKS